MGRRTIVLAVAAALAAAAVATTTTAASARPTATSQTSATSFGKTMRKLWEDHVTWTRMVIVDFAAGLPALKASETRLLRNQSDIGNAIKPYYGAGAGNTLTALLRTHILEAVPVLEAAKAGNEAKLRVALRAWYANANEIAAFLSRANPAHWPLAATRMMMRMHLDLTAREAVARLQGKWIADVAAYDAVHREILEMADTLAAGIVAQFPRRFASD
jgi:hypothetical protein